ncbi:DUF1295 domain-containing protein [Streptomyces fuscigenes]|uniref:DUF1295 domain-containing protein n=1 Tax=Streptomyces fuscigenes TaxID=1528880 RepID=UPI001F3F1D7E|nr:DUF1295 domain-containing protein [Streptomyces fuscigenes]MCF3960552.1 DUF1295 domain-containing protein [Streptomyces fuscigenes]
MSDYPWGAFGAGVGFSAVGVFAVMLVTFAIAVARGRHRYVDVAWGTAFAVSAVVSLGSAAGGGHGDGGRQWLVTALTVVWGLRLAAHIARRGRGKGEDPRYEKMLARGSGNPRLRALRKVYLLQALLVVLVSLPVQAAQYLPVALGPLAYAGCAVWLVGLFFEAVGDHQLASFTADPANRGHIMDRGLWSWTRHPNYFGDFCVWWGLFLFACGSWQTAAATVVSPVVMSLLLTMGSGKRLLERHMADRPGFADYTARTSGFFPRPPKGQPSQGV